MDITSLMVFERIKSDEELKVFRIWFLLSVYYSSFPLPVNFSTKALNPASSKGQTGSLIRLKSVSFLQIYKIYIYIYYKYIWVRLGGCVAYGKHEYLVNVFFLSCLCPDSSLLGLWKSLPPSMAPGFLLYLTTLHCLLFSTFYPWVWVCLHTHMCV